MLKIYDFKTEYQKNPLGLDKCAPGFSWKMKADHHSVVQKNYRLMVFL